MKKISILVPCYNEEENVIPLSNALVEMLQRDLPAYDYEIVFIDNCSKDSTRDKLRVICRKNPKIKAVLNAKNFETPAFATYRGGEIDFVAQSLSSSTRYLIEVKAGKGTASTAQKALAQGKADKLLYLKGATKGGIDGKTETLPIYLLEQYKFN